MLTVALETIVYLGVGLVIMMLGYFIIEQDPALLTGFFRDCSSFYDPGIF